MKMPRPFLLMTFAVLLIQFSPLLAAEKSVGSKAVGAAKGTVRNEAIKAAIEGITTLAKLPSKSGNEIRQQLMYAGNHLSQKAFERLVGQMKVMNKRAMEELLDRGGDAVLGFGKALARHGDKGLAKMAKTIIAGNGDDAGKAAIIMLRRFEGGLIELNAGQVKKLLTQLGPKRSKAFLSVVSASAQKSAAQETLSAALGGVVDGFFVLKDAYDIYTSDAPAEEKAASATAKVVETGFSTAAGATAGSAGAGFAPLIVVGLSAMAVGELTKEAIGLQYDRTRTKEAQKQQKLLLRELAISQILAIDSLIKAGKVRQAEQKSHALHKWVYKHIPDRQLFQRIDKLESAIDETEEKLEAITFLNKAREPYRLALGRLNRKEDLGDARALIQKSINILKRAPKTYDKYLIQAKKSAFNVQKAINAAIRNAPMLSIRKVEISESIPAGKWAQLTVLLQGGVPGYVNVNGDGNTYYGPVPIYQQAPDTPGEYPLTIRIRDNIQQAATQEVTVTVVAAQAPQDTEATDASAQEATKEGPEVTDRSALTGMWALSGTCTSAVLGASFQYIDAPEKLKQETADHMVGQQLTYPNLDLGMIARLKNIWRITQNGDTYTLTSNGFNDKNRLGGSRYQIIFNDANRFSGTLETRSALGGKVNIIKSKISGIRQ